MASGIDFLGWVHFEDHRVLRTSTKKKMFRNLNSKEGEKRDLNELSDIVQTSFNLNSLIQQKYSRILRMLGKI